MNDTHYFPPESRSDWETSEHAPSITFRDSARVAFELAMFGVAAFAKVEWEAPSPPALIEIEYGWAPPKDKP